MFDISKGLPLLNPKLPEQEANDLRALAEMFKQKDGVWIASSGSTRGAKASLKLVALSEQALLASAKSVNQHLQVGAQDIWAQVLPRFHVGGLGIEIRAGLSGSSFVSALREEKWDPEHFVKVCTDEKVTLASLVPTQVFDMVLAKLTPPSHLRAVLVGGAALGEDLYLEARREGWPLLPSYGMTEACSTVAAAPISSLLEADRFPNFEVLSHLDARLSAEGCLQVRGSSLLTGTAQWVESKARWTDPKSSDGWYQTEDICEISPRGLTVLGRRSEFYKILGEGVSLPKLEAVLAEILRGQSLSPALATIIAQPHPRDGWELHLVFEQSMSAANAELVLEVFNQKVMGFERLRKTKEVIKIPRTDLGKIKRSQLT